MGAVLVMPDMTQRVEVRGSVTKPSTPQEFEKFMRREVAKIRKVVKDADIKLN